MYWVTGCTLVHLGHGDPAVLAIRQALAAANKGSDPLLAATLRGSVAWQLLVAGRYSEAELVALRAAAAVEPTGDVPPEHLSVYGSLILQGATAAGRGQNARTAIDLADAASEVADRLDEDRKDYETNFGPSQIVMQRTDIRISTDQFPEALTEARQMRSGGTGLAAVSQARHALDKATALSQLGRHDEALQLLLAAESIGGEEWTRYQTLMKQVIDDSSSTTRAAPCAASPAVSASAPDPFRLRQLR
ncbi:hypothetical protein [Nocardia tengchongensis]|uniref:hypothetical protein n=1 Tax=Nocardia tengchongensis TaxID=2055889 RepID=UPI0036B74452